MMAKVMAAKLKCRAKSLTKDCHSRRGGGFVRVCFSTSLYCLSSEKK